MILCTSFSCLAWNPNDGFDDILSSNANAGCWFLQIHLYSIEAHFIVNILELIYLLKALMWQPPDKFFPKVVDIKVCLNDDFSWFFYEKWWTCGRISSTVYLYPKRKICCRVQLRYFNIWIRTRLIWYLCLAILVLVFDALWHRH